MKFQGLVALALWLEFSIAACGTGTVTTPPGGSGGKDGSAPASGYAYLAIIDMERQEKGTDFSCAASNGPGADIDAVALLRNGEVIGYGLVGSAEFIPEQGNECKNSDCPEGDCKYAPSSKSLSSADLVAATAGPPDATINKDGDDKGYLSLNGGILQIRMGDKKGEKPAQTIRSGDQIKVFEVDLSKKTDANGCACAPERYQVLLQNDGNSDLALRPSQFDKSNAATCGSAPATDARFGCGTSVFDVP